MTGASLILAVSFLPFFEAKNTTANFIINPPESGAQEIKCEKPNLVTISKCPACMGKGELLLTEQDFGQIQVQRLGNPKKTRVKCSFCLGRTTIESFLNPVALGIQIAADRNKFVANHQNKGDIPIGEAFVPQADYEKLDREKKKLIERTYGEACRTCHWSGIEACKKCDGQGFIKCPNDDCKGGWSVTKNTTSYTKRSSGGRLNNCSRYGSSSSSRRTSRTETKVNVQLCHECEGAKIVKCPECIGRKARICRKCNGIGYKQKRY